MRITLRRRPKPDPFALIDPYALHLIRTVQAQLNKTTEV